MQRHPTVPVRHISANVSNSKAKSMAVFKAVFKAAPLRQGGAASTGYVKLSILRESGGSMRKLLRNYVAAPRKPRSQISGKLNGGSYSVCLREYLPRNPFRRSSIARAIYIFELFPIRCAKMAADFSNEVSGEIDDKKFFTSRDRSAHTFCARNRGDRASKRGVFRIRDRCRRQRNTQSIPPASGRLARFGWSSRRNSGVPIYRQGRDRHRRRVRRRRAADQRQDGRLLQLGFGFDRLSARRAGALRHHYVYDRGCARELPAQGRLEGRRRRFGRPDHARRRRLARHQSDHQARDRIHPRRKRTDV